MAYNEIIMLLAGIGILLFAMNIFEGALKSLGGRKLKYVLQKFTKNGWAAIWTGTRSTSILQSSSLVSLLVLAFVGAGVMQLSSAIGVIIGANIGTTVTSLIVGRLGFGKLHISAIAMPMIAIGGLSFIFLKNEKYLSRARLLVGFGLLFLGLDFMKESVDVLKTTFDIAQYKDSSLWIFGIIGMLITIIIQSSSAVGVMTLTALGAGIVSFPASIAIVMGSNIWTTITAVIGSFGWAAIKRKVALSQVLFNVISAVIGIVFFWQYIRLTMDVLGFKWNPIMGNAILNTIFNISTAVLFWFALKPFTRMIEWIMPAKTSDDIQLRIQGATIKHKNETFAQPQIYALYEDCKILIDYIFAYNTYLFGFKKKSLFNEDMNSKDILANLNTRNSTKQKKHYENIKKIGDIMLEHLLPLKIKKLPKDVRWLSEHIETSIYSAIKSAKSLKNIQSDILDLKDTPNKNLQAMYTTMQENAATFYMHVANIIDRDYNKENFEELNTALKKITKDHKTFIENISKKIAKNKLSDLEIPTLINIDHYLYQSANTLVTALQHTYLTWSEKKTFDKIKI